MNHKGWYAIKHSNQSTKDHLLRCIINVCIVNPSLYKKNNYFSWRFCKEKEYKVIKIDLFQSIRNTIYIYIYIYIYICVCVCVCVCVWEVVYLQFDLV